MKQFKTPLLVSCLTLLTACNGQNGPTVKTVTPTPPAKNPPIVSLGDDRPVTEASLVTLTADVTDANGHVVLYQWQQIAGPTQTFDHGNYAQISFTPPMTEEAITLSFQVTVTDNSGASASDTLDITVQPSTNISELTFSDSNLTHCVTQHSNDHNWTRAAQVTMLNCDAQLIHSLQGIEQLVAIESLSVANNYLNDISPALQIGQLHALDVSDNWLTKSEIEEITAIKRWTHLGLAGTQIYTLENFSGLTELQSIDLNHNNINDIAPLMESTKLQSLSLDHNRLTNLDFIESLTELTSLSLTGNPITDISKLTNKTDWVALGLSDLNMTDISFVENMTGLTQLNLASNPINQTASIAKLLQLQSLDLSGIDNIDLMPITQLPQLTKLNLQGSDIFANATEFTDNANALSQMTQLQWLNLSYSNFNDATALANLTALKHLNLGGVYPLDNTTKLAALEQLESINFGAFIYNQQLDIDYSFLTNLTALKNLTIRTFNQEEITMLGPLTQLESLSISLNGLNAFDLNKVKHLSQLRSLQLASSNNVYNFQALTELNQLRTLSTGVRKNESLEPIANLSQLGELAITTLSASPAEPASMAFLANMPQLVKLSADQTHYNFNTIAANLTRLKYLSLTHAAINSEALAKLTELNQLDLRYFYIDNSEFLKSTTKVRYLTIYDCNINELTHIANLTDLNYLYFSNGRVNSLEPLQDLSELLILSLRNVKTTTLAPLHNAKQLKSLSFSDSELVDISALSEIQQLRSLYLDNNQISDLSPLEHLQSLRNLNLSNNDIIDINPLAALGGLQYLQLSNNPLSNVQPLYQLESLAHLTMSNMPNVSCEDGLGLISHFADINFYHNFNRVCR